MRRRMILLALVALGLMNHLLAEDPPELINYQGVLNNSEGTPLDGSFAMVFRFFNMAAGGDEILLDTHGSVTASAGLFSVELGGGTITDGSGPGIFTSLAAVFAEYSDLYLEVEVEGEMLSPRTHLVAAGYTLNARRVRGLELVSGGPLDLWVDGAASGCGGSGCSDQNDGLSLGTAKKTIQAAVIALPLGLRGSATIHISDGTYTESVIIDWRTIWDPKDPGGIILLGNEAFPENVVLDGENVLETGIAVRGSVEIRGIEVRNFLGTGIGFFYGFTVVDNCRILNNGHGFEIGQSPGEILNVLVSGNNEGVEVADSEELIINGGRFNNNITYGLRISTGSKVFIEDGQVNNNGTVGIQVELGQLVLDPHVGSLVVLGNQDHGVVARDNGVVDFNGRAGLTIQGNGSGSLQSSYHSTIRGYANGTLDGIPPCTAANLSICEP